jgi:hypothetical protein
MVITVAGLPGLKSDRTLMNIEYARKEYDFPIRVDWVSDIREMGAIGIIHTPSVMVNARVRSSGRIPNISEIKRWIELETTVVPVAD